MSDDHKIIYLEPECCVDESEGRTWCQDPVYDCDESDEGALQSTAYIRMDIYDSKVKRIEEIEAALKEVMDFAGSCIDEESALSYLEEIGLDLKPLLEGDSK